jgi:hypothetical protein
MEEEKEELRNFLLLHAFFGKNLELSILNNALHVIFRKKIFVTRAYCYLILWIALNSTVTIGLLTGIFVEQIDYKSSLEMIGIFVVANYVFFVLYVKDLYVTYLLNFMRDQFLNFLSKESDFKMLRTRLQKTFQIKNQLRWGVIISLIGHFSFILYDFSLPQRAGWGIMVASFIINTIYASVFYLLYHFLEFIRKDLNHFSFKIFSPDPGNSEIIRSLSRVFTIGVYMNFIFTLIFNLCFIIYRDIVKVNIYFITLFIWIAVILQFLSYYSSLSDIIFKQKRISITEIQAIIQVKVDNLLLGKITSSEKDDIDVATKLLEYHNKVLVTKNDVLNSRVIINILSTLLVSILVNLTTKNIDKVGLFLTYIRKAFL